MAPRAPALLAAPAAGAVLVVARVLVAVNGAVPSGPATCPAAVRRRLQHRQQLRVVPAVQRQLAGLRKRGDARAGAARQLGMCSGGQRPSSCMLTAACKWQLHGKSMQLACCEIP